MPYVENAAKLTRWLSPEAGRTISIGTTAWRPNERIVGIYHVEKDEAVRGGWNLRYETLMEWLAEESKLRVLCATSTIAQGINFPVSSVFLASRFVPSRGKSIEMKPRDFWNLAGRAGRLQHDSVGIAGLASGKAPKEIKNYVGRATGELVSQLVTLLDGLEKEGKLNDLESVINTEQWTDFRCYVAHLWNEKQNLDAVLADTEQLLRNTYGYGALRSSPGGEARAKVLLEATKSYARMIAEHSENATLADATGFAPEGVRTALLELNRLEKKLTVSDWMPESLFGPQTGGNLSYLFGIMLRVPQLKKQLEEIGGEEFNRKQLAGISIDWVSGKSLNEIAKKFFSGEHTASITGACRAIYRNLVNSGPWGLAALSKMPTSGINFKSLSEEEVRRINILPSMLYHGVSSGEAVLMRMNAAPRSIAEPLGIKFREETGGQSKYQSVGEARKFLKSLQQRDWEQAKPANSLLSGQEYKTIWELLSGEGR